MKNWLSKSVMKGLKNVKNREEPVSIFSMCIHQKLIKDGCAACGLIGNRKEVVKQKSEIDIIYEKISQLEKRIVDIEDKQRPEIYNDC